MDTKQTDTDTFHEHELYEHESQCEAPRLQGGACGALAGQSSTLRIPGKPEKRTLSEGEVDRQCGLTLSGSVEKGEELLGDLPVHRGNRFQILH